MTIPFKNVPPDMIGEVWIHCTCWYDGEEPCCRCGDNTLNGDETFCPCPPPEGSAL